MEDLNITPSGAEWIMNSFLNSITNMWAMLGYRVEDCQDPCILAYGTQ
jgi:hypothetical protein